MVKASMSGGGVRGAEEAMVAEAADGLIATSASSLGAAIAIVRSRLAAGESPDLIALRRLVARALSLLPGTDRRLATDHAYLVLADELAGLVRQIALERDLLLARIQSAPRARRAEASYRAVGRRS